MGWCRRYSELLIGQGNGTRPSLKSPVPPAHSRLHLSRSRPERKSWESQEGLSQSPSEGPATGGGWSHALLFPITMLSPPCSLAATQGCQECRERGVTASPGAQHGHTQHLEKLGGCGGPPKARDDMALL